MTPAQRRALRIGAALHKATRARASMAALMTWPGIDVLTPAAQAGYLMSIAQADRHIRLMRLLLADELEATAVVPGRHRAP